VGAPGWTSCPPPSASAAGLTNLAGGLDAALPLLERSRPGRIRRLVIVSDDEPDHQDNHRLASLFERAGKVDIRMSYIHVGAAGAGAAEREFAASPRFGFCTEAVTVNVLTAVIRKAAAGSRKNEK
jgi:hypothetical protein